MYITKTLKNTIDFNWDLYFQQDKFNDENIRNSKEILFELREHLKENKFQISFVFSKMMKVLLDNIEFEDQLKILELGAATGFLTRWFLNNYSGAGVLVDKNNSAFEKYNEIKDDVKDRISYCISDVFELDLNEKFNLVCSFGLIEHFKNKQEIIEAHKKFVSPNGYILIVVPKDTILTRVFMEAHPELNHGYRELINEKEFNLILKENNVEVLEISSSEGYCYDFMAALCKA
jgi:2-polyprenyl-3-methyl-5-hydroxy-6-metoxy-1,4-benzoquinol methylase